MSFFTIFATGYLTIGIPSVFRPGKEYLQETIKSLVRATDTGDRQKIVLVVFLADQNLTRVHDRARLLQFRFGHLLDSGYLQIAYPYGLQYPNYSTLKRNFGDPPERVKWRSKQNLDYAYLFTYCRNISTYYLQLEDDVSAVRGFAKRLQSFVEQKNNDNTTWFCIQFCNLGFIGKLFRSSDLDEIVTYIIMFFDEQPGDLLLKYLQKIKTQFQDIISYPTLFQHEGVVSSLEGKEQRQKDWHFVESHNVAKKTFFVTNPAASISTTMRTFEDNFPIRAYDLSDRFFWGMTPVRGDYYRILLQSPQNFTRIYIKTGHFMRTSDVLENGAVWISQGQEFFYYGKFINGKYDTREQNITVTNDIICIVIQVTENQNQWLIIREIALFHADDADVATDDTDLEYKAVQNFQPQNVQQNFHQNVHGSNVNVPQIEAMKRKLNEMRRQYEEHVRHLQRMIQNSVHN